MHRLIRRFVQRLSEAACIGPHPVDAISKRVCSVVSSVVTAASDCQTLPRLEPE